jgi:hypothetical protein
MVFNRWYVHYKILIPDNLKKNIRSYLLPLFILLANTIQAQNDTLLFKNGDFIVGEIKSFDKAVITISTSYSDVDFKIEWQGVKEIYTGRLFFITLADGTKHTGTVHSISGTGFVAITDLSGERIEIVIDDLVFLKPYDTRFWSRITASIDIGLSVTKDNDLKQFNSNSTLGYLTKNWSAQAYGDNTTVDQEDAERTQRTDAGLTFQYFLKRDWYLIIAPTVLSNSEQAIKLRFVGKAGAGKYLKHTNRDYLGIAAGLSFNNETYTNETPERQSLELFSSVGSNIFDVGDFSLTSTLTGYRSLSEKDRWRADFNFDAKYKFTPDFYLKAGVSFNYDNQPAISGNEFDYQFNTSIGWELD